MLEHFRDCIPAEVVYSEYILAHKGELLLSHIAERWVNTVNEAATLADKYILAHKGKLGRSCVPEVHATSTNVGRCAKMVWSASTKPNHYSHSGGFDEFCKYFPGKRINLRRQYIC